MKCNFVLNFDIEPWMIQGIICCMVEENPRVKLTEENISKFLKEYTHTYGIHGLHELEMMYNGSAVWELANYHPLF